MGKYLVLLFVLVVGIGYTFNESISEEICANTAAAEHAPAAQATTQCSSCPAKAPITNPVVTFAQPSSTFAPHIDDLTEKTASLASTLFRPPKYSNQQTI
ncbi:hypothetical protein [Vibrio sp. SCSIO 43136]|uniref:hypothetical protein n=1 Tax=Vibrio sp. SCSIO 43136 TaxID=2819101 RepID=UPI002074FC4A|nr:hypothetical protein [Vibrio sp. SCSIO 43136]USD67940.1 hypothetical protein J4N39_17330 [Vibrio sp. SCSIO 43136]